MDQQQQQQQGINISNLASAPLIPKQKMAEIVSLVAPGERLDPPVEMMLSKIAEEFILSVGRHAVQLTRHRKSTVVEGKDVNLALMINYEINAMPGDGSGNINGGTSVNPHPIHQQNLSSISKDQYNLDNAS